MALYGSLYGLPDEALARMLRIQPEEVHWLVQLIMEVSKLKNVSPTASKDIISKLVDKALESLDDALSEDKRMELMLKDSIKLVEALKDGMPKAHND